MIAVEGHQNKPSGKKDQQRGDDHRVTNLSGGGGTDIDAVPDKGGKGDHGDENHVKMIGTSL